jgi:hypothetical protein
MADTAEQAKKYFLYIDILGFSSLVRQGRVGDLYKRLDSLDARGHPSFNTIVFSDTIVIYNKDDLDWDENDKTAIVSRLCEFATDLFYRLISQNIHFRGYVCCGEFIHSKMEHIEAFYGRASWTHIIEQTKSNVRDCSLKPICFAISGYSKATSTMSIVIMFICWSLYGK